MYDIRHAITFASAAPPHPELRTQIVNRRLKRSAVFAFLVSRMKKIPLHGGGFAIVDDADYERLSAHRWSRRQGRNGCVYAVAGRRRMHREVLGVGPDCMVDHINHDGLDNRRQNLRPCTNGQNMANQLKRAGTSSRFKGVSVRPDGRCEVSITHQGDTIYLGGFPTEERAARQYDRAARLFFGPFALTNEVLGLFEQGQRAS